MRSAMRVLHLVKTSDGGVWAAEQAAELVGRGVEVHAAVPSLEGAAIDTWKTAGAVLHEFDAHFPVRTPWRLRTVLAGFRDLVSRVRPDLVHSHFVGTTLVMRLALGRSNPLPRVFQVAGPLHLEHAPYRRAEIGLAGKRDYWIGASRYTVQLYERAGVATEQLFQSYPGTRVDRFVPGRFGEFRAKLGITQDEIVVGNISLFYAPKRYLGQTEGMKRQELLIEALSLLLPTEPRLRGVLAGGPYGRAQGYLERLRARAGRLGGGRILLPGMIARGEVARAWADFDLVVHVPLSENCGGVVEPLLCGVPVIASRTGGIPEVVLDGRTGVLLDVVTPESLAEAIGVALGDLDRHRALAMSGGDLARRMFDVSRTAEEVHSVYRYLLEGGPRPSSVDWTRWPHSGMGRP